MDTEISRPIDRLLIPFGRLLHHELTGGLLLFAAAALALLWANSPFQGSYHDLWHTHLSLTFGSFVVDKSLHHWISDGLMAAFFFLVGLEIKREMIGGQLSSWRDALLPFAAAAGGLCLPAILYLVANPPGAPGVSGWAIPTATDIAFALGVLSLLGRRVPVALKVFLTAIAIVDDIAAVLVIALFYTGEISLAHLGFAFLALLVMAVGNLLGVRSAWFYALVGIGCVWTGFLLSGVHATLAGFLAALTIPARPTVDEEHLVSRLGEQIEAFQQIPPNSIPLLESQQRLLLNHIRQQVNHADTPLQELEEALHPLIMSVVLPLFALANAGISLGQELREHLMSPIAVGIMVGLVLGKTLGIFGATWIAVKSGLASLPKGLAWPQVFGVSMLGGVGFTMSLFITQLAFPDSMMVDQAKAGILTGSVLSALLGCAFLWRLTRPEDTTNP